MENKVEILKQSQYNFGFLSALATNDVCIVRALDVSWAKTIGLSVRVHRTNIGSGGGGNAKFTFYLYGTNPSATDGTDFLTASIAQSSDITTSTSAGSLITLSTGTVLTDAAHPFLRVVLRATAPTTGSVNLYAELSATLVLRAP